MPQRDPVVVARWWLGRHIAAGLGDNAGDTWR
jgi:hypothetical protein